MILRVYFKKRGRKEKKIKQINNFINKSFKESNNPKTSFKDHLPHSTYAQTVTKRINFLLFFV